MVIHVEENANNAFFLNYYRINSQYDSSCNFLKSVFWKEFSQYCFYRSYLACPQYVKSLFLFLHEEILFIDSQAQVERKILHQQCVSLCFNQLLSADGDVDSSSPSYLDAGVDFVQAAASYKRMFYRAESF